MEKTELFDLIERISALIRSEERKKCTELGLQVVHMQVLDYLSRCNQFSNTPAAVTKYFGMTRGTVSQTLLLLEKKGYIKKTNDANDRRMVHLSLLDRGNSILQQARPTELFERAAVILKERGSKNEEDGFLKVLSALQEANNSQSFGLCKTCQYFIKTSSGFMCGLTRGPLSQCDSEKICQEHKVAKH
jgi:MarR family transcriptional regulator, negative regulator of the multidrug operon emrRAB